VDGFELAECFIHASARTKVVPPLAEDRFADVMGLPRKLEPARP
jgi:hypothetical protein